MSKKRVLALRRLTRKYVSEREVDVAKEFFTYACEARFRRRCALALRILFKRPLP